MQKKKFHLFLAIIWTFTAVILLVTVCADIVFIETTGRPVFLIVISGLAALLSCATAIGNYIRYKQIRKNTDK